MTAAKLAFCWRLAVGPAVDRASRVRQERPGELIIEVEDPRWKQELERALPLVKNRLEYLLGAEAVARMIVRSSG